MWDRPSKVIDYLCCVCKCVMHTAVVIVLFFSHLTWKIWHAHLPYVGFICALKFLKTQGKFKCVFQCWSTVHEIKCSTIFLHTFSLLHQMRPVLYCTHTHTQQLSCTGLTGNTWSQDWYMKALCVNHHLIILIYFSPFKCVSFHFLLVCVKQLCDTGHWSDLT